MKLDRRRTVAPDLAGRAPRVMRVAVECAPLRERPALDCGLDTQALFGEAFLVYDLRDGWAYGQLARDRYVGYAAADAFLADARAPTHRVAAPRTVLYPAPDMKTPARGALPLNAEATVDAQVGDFARLSNGLYVWRAHLAPLRAAAEDFVAVAEAFAGAPYLWGGKTWLGLDCSGLVQTALQAAGVDAPRDTDMQQAELGEALAPDAPLRRGDLVFWKGHVGLMQDDARLIHANGHHMQVASEPFRAARERIAAKSFGEIVAIKRIV